jgi:hypothetical protein
VWMRSTEVPGQRSDSQEKVPPGYSIHTMSCKVAASGESLVTGPTVESLWGGLATSPSRGHRWLLLHLWFTGISTRDKTHVPRSCPGRLPIVKGVGKSLIHGDTRRRMRRVCVNGVIRSTWLRLHGWLVQLCVLQVLLV